VLSQRGLTIAGGLIVLALLAGSFLNQRIGGLGSDPSAKPPPDPSVAQVLRVTDGDTIVVRFLSGAERRVRYIGVDTPEVFPEKECHGDEATNANNGLVAGERVRLVFDRERTDRFDRLLAYVYRARDDVFVNAQLVARGHATVLTIPPNVRFAPEFARLQARARSERLGVWLCPPA
jgi:micrococcal nuclease